VPADGKQAARQKLAVFGREYAERKDVLERASRQLQDERDEAILSAFADGLTTREIAQVLGDISHQRIAQIVQQR
jgi:DNA-directed RNA polymerase specialized sigma24 family protein